MSSTVYGYVRVSTERQDTGSDAQRHALDAAGCGEIIEEQASGQKARPMLAELVNRLEPGDVLTVVRFDRISRSVADFYAIGEHIRARDASLRSLAEQFDTSTPIGRAMMGFAAIWAELEADTTRERVNNGLTAARARGQRLGRRYAIDSAAAGKIARRLGRRADQGAGPRVPGIAQDYPTHPRAGWDHVANWTSRRRAGAIGSARRTVVATIMGGDARNLLVSRADTRYIRP